MSDQSNSTCSNILLKIIHSDIPIALGFTTPPKVPQPQKNQATNKLSTRKSLWIILDTERNIYEKYVTAKLKQELICKVQRRFLPLQYSYDT